jgi:hypothetical protein
MQADALEKTPALAATAHTASVSPELVNMDGYIRDSENLW